MATILTIGHQSYLVKNPTQAAKAIAALAGLVALDQKYVGGEMIEVYWPKEGQSKIGFETVRNEQIIPRKPLPEEVEELERRVFRQPAPRQPRLLKL